MAYTAVLLSDTATPSWHEGYREMPFVFVGSAALAAGGLGMLAAPTGEAAPARYFALGGAALELAAEHRMESSMGVTAEPLHEGKAGAFMKAAKTLTAAGALGTLFAGRSRRVAAASGASLLAARCAPGSGSSTPASSRRVTPSTPSFRSASGSRRTTAGDSRKERQPGDGAARLSSARCPPYRSSSPWPRAPARAARRRPPGSRPSGPRGRLSRWCRC